MRVSRPLAALACVALSGVALAACQDQASGTITGHDGARAVQTFTNPSTEGCHRFRADVTRVDNFTQNSILLYKTPDCTAPQGQEGTYLDMQGSDEVVRSTGPWRSFSFAPG
ncbi:hypothetical protein [Streptomyces cellostaticus]|uniref:hypothetical protein n=1 Tax=Streptomyces TaxID=1883 RepID=UPI00202713B0|nr:hypothetical protein [Streptomyces cellostaticus]